MMTTLLKDATYPILDVVDGKLVEKQVPALVSLNERLRDISLKIRFGASVAGTKC